MEGRKFIDTKYEKREDKEYKINTLEIREINLLVDDWDWLHENMMNDDWECGNSNGFFQDDNDFVYLDCQMVAERMDEWKDELRDNGETFNEYQETFQKNYNRIYGVLTENFDFDVFYYKYINKKDKGLEPRREKNE